MSGPGKPPELWAILDVYPAVQRADKKGNVKDDQAKGGEVIKFP